MNTFLILFINCNWVVTRWQWLFNTHTKHGIGLAKHEIVLTKHEIDLAKHEIGLTKHEIGSERNSKPFP
jgi:hypothetical protein